MRLRVKPATALVLASTIAFAGAPSRGDEVGEWVANLKCSSIVNSDGKILPGFTKFYIWLDGFWAGISSVGPVNLVKEKMPDSLSILVLTGSAKEQDSSALEQAFDAAAMVLGLSLKPTHLKNPFEGR